MKILITGGNGYVAKSLYKALKDKYEITLITRQDFDLTDAKETIQWFNDKEFDVVIHTAIVGGSRLKQENNSILNQNLQMYYNLLSCKDKYKKFINFGSGAELFTEHTPYSLSKYIIKESIKELNNFYNIRIFGIFDENEWDTRFIKTSIKNYISHKPIAIHQNKLMDFFYMEDLILVVKYYIKEEKLLKEFNCTYLESKTLLQIAEMINHLDKHRVEISVLKDGLVKGYIGSWDGLILPLVGLEQGIINTYNKLKHEC
jgi:GDP-L-fucose synthase|tara:strand:+ start:5693 stop:6469 length:777 start_codon:yes stop_codon:yes gene_type:complete